MRPSFFINTINPLSGLDAEKQLKKCFFSPFFPKSKLADLVFFGHFLKNPRWPTILLLTCASSWQSDVVHLVCELS